VSTVPAPSADLAARDALLELRDVSVIRAGRTVLDRVSLRIDVGERVAILGPNGCGKSTLLKLLTRELYPVAAPGSSLRILGRERWDVATLRRGFGIVARDLGEALALGGSVRDVVLSGFFASHGIFAHHAVTPEMAARADAALARFGLAALAERHAAELSSGQAQRALIARALAPGPATLVFDEPGVALDVAAKADLAAAMRDIVRAGTGLIVVTHDFAELVPEVQRVVFMRDGRFVGDGVRADMLRGHRLSALFGVDVVRCATCGATEVHHTA